MDTIGRYSPLQIANSFIHLSKQKGESGGGLTPLKLIKLTYFFYAWYLAICDERPFSELPEAWKHGPVFPSVYAVFSKYRDMKIDEYYFHYDLEDNSNNTIPDVPILSDGPDDKVARNIVISIWKYYKKYSAWDLRNITHEDDGPWVKTWNNGAGNRAVIELDEVVKERALIAIHKLKI